MVKRFWTLSLAIYTTLGLPMEPAAAQQTGGILKFYHRDSPASMSIHEEATISTVAPVMSVFNNLVLFKQHEKQNRLDLIEPELAESWSWSEEGTELTFPLRQGVKWHDGKPFTAKDVKCTWDMLTGKSNEKLRLNPRKSWYRNLEEVTINGEYEVTFRLKRPQPSFLALLASGWSPVYPCHVPAKDMRRQPIGTGPFKLVSFESNRSIKLAKNPDYWKPGRPYLDGVEMSIIGNRSTRVLAFVANEFDLTFVADITVPLIADVTSRAPKAICQLAPTSVSTNLIVNRNKPPFNDVRLRKAMALALDRNAMIDILTGGKASIAGAMMASPEGGWGMPKEMVMALPGYGGDQAARQAEARSIMESLGYGPDKRLKVKVSTRDFQNFKDPAVLLVDQLNRIYFDAELEIIESAVWYGRITRQDYAVGLNLTGSGVDDPDVTLAEGYACNSDRNYTKYCNPEIEKLLAEQSQEANIAKRKEIVWRIERVLAEDVARPIIFHGYAATCWHPHLKGFVLHENSIYNNWRLESVWLDK